MSKKSFIDSVEVGSPCSEDWHQMEGTDKIRFCSHCSKHVNNLSEMTRKEAMRLVRASGGNLCIRYLQHPVTRRPIFAGQLLQITRRAPTLAAGVMTASVGLSTLTYAQGGANPVIADATRVVAQEAIRDDRSIYGTISGTVADRMGAVIPGAKVSLFSVDAGRSETTLTNDEGLYKFAKLEPGKYRLEWEAPGFKKNVREINVTTSDATVEDVAMEIGFELVVDVVADVETVVLGGVMVSVDYSSELARAIANDDVEHVRELLVRGADVNRKEKDYDNMTPLFVGVENGNVEIVEILLNFGAKVNARDKQKQTALMRLDGDATPELVDLLIRHGAKVNLIDKHGDTALIVAAGLADHQVLKALIDAGADVNTKNKARRTALMNAAEADELESVRVLLTAGADVNARNTDGDSAWSLTTNQEVRSLLESFGAETREDDEEDTPDEP